MDTNSINQLSDSLSLPQLDNPASSNMSSDSYFSFENYLWLNVIAILCYSYASYYFYRIVKRANQASNLNPEDETRVDLIKYELHKNLVIYCTFRIVVFCLTFALGNPLDNSFTCFLLNIFKFFPTLILMSILLFYVSFLIEKYYQIKYKKADIFFNPSLEILNMIIYIIFSLFTFGCLMKERYDTYIILCQGISAFVSLIISILYLYYGINLSNIYSIKKAISSELKEKKFLHKKLLTLALTIGILYLVKSLVSFAIFLQFVDEFSIISNKNIFDVLNILIFELLVVALLGHTKNSDASDSNKRRDNFELINNEFYFDYSHNPNQDRFADEDDKNADFAEPLINNE